MGRLSLTFLVSAMLLPQRAGAQQNGDFEATVRAAMAGSLEKQRASIQKQTGAPPLQTPGSNGGFFTVSWPAPPSFQAAAMSAANPINGPDCQPMAKGDLEKIVATATEREGISPELVRLVIGKESAAKPCAVSPKGAQGLMQLMPATAADLGVQDAFDPQQNVDGGVRLLKKLLTKYSGDVPLALGAYNAGSGRVDEVGGIPQIPETLNYVSDIMSRLRIE